LIDFGRKGRREEGENGGKGGGRKGRREERGDYSETAGNKPAVCVLNI